MIVVQNFTLYPELTMKEEALIAIVRDRDYIGVI